MLEGLMFKPTKGVLFYKFLLSLLFFAFLVAVGLLFFGFSDIPNTQEVFQTEQDLRNSRSFLWANTAVSQANKLLEENKGRPMDTIESINYIYRLSKTDSKNKEIAGNFGANFSPQDDKEYLHKLSYRIEYTLNGKRDVIYVMVEMLGSQDLIISSTNYKVTATTSPREYANQLNKWLSCTDMQAMDPLREKTFNDYAMAAIKGEIEWR